MCGILYTRYSLVHATSHAENIVAGEKNRYTSPDTNILQSRVSQSQPLSGHEGGTWEKEGQYMSTVSSLLA